VISSSPNQPFNAFKVFVLVVSGESFSISSTHKIDKIILSFLQYLPTVLFKIWRHYIGVLRWRLGACGRAARHVAKTTRVEPTNRRHCLPRWGLRHHLRTI
jgi:hypothetical protein